VFIAILMEVLVYMYCNERDETWSSSCLDGGTSRPNAKHRELTPAGPHLTSRHMLSAYMYIQCNCPSHPLATHHTYLGDSQGRRVHANRAIYFYGKSRQQIRGAVGIETFD